MEPLGLKELPLIRDMMRGHLERTLGFYLKNLDDGRLPRDKDGKLQVLSVGCGFGYEASGVYKTFPNVAYTGIDTNRIAIEAAKRGNDDLPPDKFTFKVEDAKQIKEGEENKYGLVIIRNPQVLGSVKVNEKDVLEMDRESIEMWRNILESSLKKLHPLGYLFITTETDEEKNKVVEYLKANNIEVLFANPNTASIILEGTFRDSIVVIGRKGG